MFEKEYETLRQELSDNKKYVFERPLLIITAAFIFSDFVMETPYAILFPILVIYLLLFNLKFTSNRLNSSARIVSYIRLFIEKKDPKNYQWETFLAKYRKHGKEGGLRYYHIIYWFHIITAIVFFIFELLLYLDNQIDLKSNDLIKESITILSISFCVIGLFFLIKFGIETYPQKVIRYFENEKTIVKKTIDELEEKRRPTKAHRQ